MELPAPPLSPPLQPLEAQGPAAGGAYGGLSPNRRRLLASLHAHDAEERMERRLREAADPLSLHADERGLLLLAAAGLLLLLSAWALHSPAAVHQPVGQRLPVEDAWLSQWMVRGAELPWSDKQRAALHNQLQAALSDDWPEDSDGQSDATAPDPSQHSPRAVSPVPSVFPIPALALTASVAASHAGSSPVPAALLASSASVAVGAAGLRVSSGVAGSVCSRVVDRADCGERWRCGGHGECVVRAEHCRGIQRFREWMCECECEWGGVWCQPPTSGGCDNQPPPLPALLSGE